MRKLILVSAVVVALGVAGTAAAALAPWTYDPGNTGCVTSTYSNGTLHLAQNCSTSTNASAGADLTGLDGQTFVSSSFTLASTSQCQGGSPRFNVQTANGLFFLGCNNVAPVVNGDGTATYTFTAQTLAAAGQQVPTPTGAISSVEVLIDVQGTADLSKIAVNGIQQVPVVDRSGKNACKNGGWKTFTNPSFRNQGQCVKHFVHLANADRKAAKAQKTGHGHANGHAKKHA